MNSIPNLIYVARTLHFHICLLKSPLIHHSNLVLGLSRIPFSSRISFQLIFTTSLVFVTSSYPVFKVLIIVHLKSLKYDVILRMS